MGDHHFLIRYSFTGVVLLLFVLAGLWVVDGQAALSLLGGLWKGSESGSAVLSAIATVPVIGVMVHGICLVYIYGLRGHSFPDTARRDIAAAIRHAVAKQEFVGPDYARHFDDLETRRRREADKEADPCAEQRRRIFLLSDLVAEFREEIECIRKQKPQRERWKPMPDDSLFVWLYYFYVPEHLIEWARRRRDYHYLGVNWALAATLGLPLGMLAAWYASVYSQSTLSYVGAWKTFNVVLLFLFWLAWICGSFWLGLTMKHDVDSMELAWACIACTQLKSERLPLPQLKLDQRA